MLDIRKVLYSELVFSYLEDIGYPELVTEFSSESVAKSIAGSIKAFYAQDISPRMCAICIWGMTMRLQIIPDAKNQVKH